MIDDARCKVNLPDMQRVVVAMLIRSVARDMSERANSHIGIVVAGKGVDGRGYAAGGPELQAAAGRGWARRAIDAYHEFNADRLVAERNFGGAMVEATIEVGAASGRVGVLRGAGREPRQGAAS